MYTALCENLKSLDTAAHVTRKERKEPTPVFGVLGSCHVLEGFGIYMIGILDSYLMCGRLVSPACGSLDM